MIHSKQNKCSRSLEYC